MEREIAGFGASGRNGGWCSAGFPVSPGALAAAVRGGGRPRRTRWRCTSRSTRSGGSAPRRGSTPSTSRAGRCASPAGRTSCPALERAYADGAGTRAWPTTTSCSTPRRPAARVRITDALGALFYTGQRGDPPGPAGARPGPRRRAAGRHDLRADRRSPTTSPARRRACSRRAARCGRGRSSSPARPTCRSCRSCAGS